MSPRRRPKTADEIGSIHIDQAARPQKPPVGAGDDFRRDHLLSRPRPERVVPLPEPVRMPDRVNGRPLEDWEERLYVEVMQRERRRELAMFGGLTG